jgi:small-conductance mechanosensitive channel
MKPSFRRIAVFALGCAVSMLAEAVTPADQILDQPIDVAAVVVDGKHLFKVRGASSFPAANRAGAIARRIEQAADDAAFQPESLRVAPDGENRAILAGPLRIMLVTDADAELDRLSPEDVALANANAIQSAIVAYRQSRTRESLVRNGAYALLATVALIAGIALLLWAAGRLRRTIERIVHARVRTVGIQSFEIVRVEHVRRGLTTLLRLLTFVVGAGLVFLWVDFALGRFPWTAGFAHDLLAYVVAPLVTLGRGFASAIPNLIFLVVLYFVVRGILRIVRLFFDAVDRGGVKLSGFEREWAIPTYKIVRFAIIALAIVVAYPYIPGSDSAAFKGVSLFLGVVFSLGSSTAISNIIAGYLMTYRRAFRVGDRVKIVDIVGDVTAMRLQVTHLRTPKNEEVVVPNSQIVNGHVVNYSTLAKNEKLWLHTKVGIGYETPWRQVEAMLLEAAGRSTGLLSSPPPFVLQTLLGDFAVTYELNVATDDPHAMPSLYSDLHRNILDVFNEYGVAIMTPAYVADPSEAKVVPRSRWYTPPATSQG